MSHSLLKGYEEIKQGDNKYNNNKQYLYKFKEITDIF